MWEAVGLKLVDALGSPLLASSDLAGDVIRALVGRNPGVTRDPVALHVHSKLLELPGALQDLPQDVGVAVALPRGITRFVEADLIQAIPAVAEDPHAASSQTAAFPGFHLVAGVLEGLQVGHPANRDIRASFWSRGKEGRKKRTYSSTSSESSTGTLMGQSLGRCLAKNKLDVTTFSR